MRAKSILLIEDDYVDVTSVKRALAKLNVKHTLHVAHNGVDGLSILNGNPATGEKVLPDIILLDLNMPKMNGLEFLSIVKNYYSLKNIKVFVMTTSSEEYDVVATQQLGVEGYILKPLDFDGPGKGPHAEAVKNLKARLLEDDLKIPFLFAASGTKSASFAIKAQLATMKKMTLALLHYFAGSKTVAVATIAVSSVTVAVQQAGELPVKPAQVEIEKVVAREAVVAVTPEIEDEPLVVVSAEPSGPLKKMIGEEEAVPELQAKEEPHHPCVIKMMTVQSDDESEDAPSSDLENGDEIITTGL